VLNRYEFNVPTWENPKRVGAGVPARAGEATKVEREDDIFVVVVVVVW